DNEISWLDWKGYKSGNSEMFRFVKNLIAFRKKHKILHMGQELSMTDSLSCGFPGISYHSSSAWYGELDGQNRKIGVMYCGKYADEDELIYIAYNMHWMEHTFALPALPGGYRWNVALDTSEGILEEDKWRLLPDSRQVQVSSRTVIVLIGRKHKDVKESNRTLHNHHKA
ncbi:MAG: alpha-amylase, partial [Lachnospiraceae bacterium]|nr:alpha-amylase [Lachnospiraceae bacterium]